MASSAGSLQLLRSSQNTLKYNYLTRWNTSNYMKFNENDSLIFMFLAKSVENIVKFTDFFVADKNRTFELCGKESISIYRHTQHERVVNTGRCYPGC